MSVRQAFIGDFYFGEAPYSLVPELLLLRFDLLLELCDSSLVAILQLLYLDGVVERRELLLLLVDYLLKPLDVGLLIRPALLLVSLIFHAITIIEAKATGHRTHQSAFPLNNLLTVPSC